MTKVTRRTFIELCSAAALGFAGLNRLLTTTAFADPAPSMVTDRYDPLLDDPHHIIQLPKGFSYRIIATRGEIMSDGFAVPGLPDAMAAFPGENNKTVVVCNHELTPRDPGPFGANWSDFGRVDKYKLYDAGSGRTPCTGGTSTLVYDTNAQRVESHFLSLCGTMRNCAGGATPWGTWITCEEAVMSKGHYPENNYFADEDHGYNFEVPASGKMELTKAVPLKAMGRFNHEAVCVDPRTSIVYQTEDRHDGLITRFIPDKAENLSGGRLQALCVRDRAGCDTRNWDAATAELIATGEPLAVRWIDLEDIQAPKDDLRTRGFEAGAARFARGEGMWFGDNEAYFACTSGGKEQHGQIWRYVPSADEGSRGEADAPGSLELFLEPNNSDILKKADNLTVAPWGDVMLCEDRKGKTVRVVGVTPEGKCYTFANNLVGSEFAGVAFSPDRSTMFINLQDAGLTLAITGPWT